MSRYQDQRREHQRRDPSRGGTPSGGRRPGKPGQRAGKQPAGRSGPRPAELERGRAVGILGGMLSFVAGFAVAGVGVLVGAGGTPPYLAAVGVGFAGIGVIGWFYQRGAPRLPRGASPVPQPRLWAPDFLRGLAGAVGLRPVPVVVVLYLLAAVGVLGNLVVPMVRGR